MLRTVFLSLSWCVATVGAQASPAIAMRGHEDADAPGDTVELGTVTVTAQSVKDVIPAQTLSGRTLDGLRSHSVADALRYFSGVQLKDYGGVGGVKTVNIRSMGSQHLGVFYNGIELGNAQNGQVDLGKYSLQNVESVDLYNGQRSDIFQSAREFGSAGSIYINTRIPRFAEGKRYNVRGGFRTGSFGLANPFASVEYRLSDRVSVTGDAEYVYAHGRYKFRYRRVTPSGETAYDTTATRQNGDINAFRGEASVYGRTGSGSWRVRGYHYNSERGIPGAIVNNVWRRGERLTDRNTFVQGRWTQDVSERWSVRVNAKYAYDYTHYVNNDDRLLRVDNTYRQTEVYLSWSNRVRLLPDWDMSVAADWQYNALRDFADVHRNTVWTSVATGYSLGDVLRVQASVLLTDILEQRRGGDGAPDKHKLTPAAFVSYKPLRGHNLVLRAFAKQSYRMPTFNDLYYTDMGNAFLRPECATQYNGGVLYDVSPSVSWLRFVRVGADVYYNDIRDKIVAYPKGQQFRWTMLNLGRVHITGVDANASATVAAGGVGLTGRLQYTYQRAIDVTDRGDTYYGHQIPYIPWHSGSASLSAEWRGWLANYSFIYTGERYNQQENIPVNYTQPWYTSDLSLQKSVTLGRVGLTVTGEVNNLFGQDYDVIINYPMPGRNYKVSVTVTI